MCFNAVENTHWQQFCVDKFVKNKTHPVETLSLHIKFRKLSSDDLFCESVQKFTRMHNLYLKSKCFTMDRSKLMVQKCFNSFLRGFYRAKCILEFRRMHRSASECNISTQKETLSGMNTVRSRIHPSRRGHDSRI